MRVLYLHQYFNTPSMAGGTRSFEMARRLAAKGHEVHLLTTWRQDSKRRGWFKTVEAGIYVHWLPVPYSNSMGFLARIRAFLTFAFGCARKAASIPADVVFATSTPLTIALPALYAASKQNIPMVFEVRDLWPDVPIAMGILKNRFLIALARLLEHAAYSRSVGIVALAPGMKDAIVAKGIPPLKVAVIPNGCDFDIFDSQTDDEPTTGVPAGDVLILYIGSLGLANGADYIPRLAACVSEEAPSHRINFVVIGDGRERTRVQELAACLSLLDKSVFFLGALPKTDVAAWLRASDATIMTYDGPAIVYRDSVSNKFFDSIAAGKPVIANFAGFSSLIASDAGAGFIISKDPKTGAKQFLQLLSTEGLLKKAGVAAASLARERFDRDHLADSLEVVLTNAVTRKRSLA